MIALALGVIPWRRIFLVLAGFFMLLAAVFWGTGHDPKSRRQSGMHASSPSAWA